jgi:hypothetical protein
VHSLVREVSTLRNAFDRLALDGRGRASVHISTKMHRRILAPLLVMLGACATQPSVDELVSTPVIVTKFDTQVDFGTFDTFAVNPTVSLVRDVGDGGTLAPDKASALVDRITAQMSARGYRLVAVSDRPSLGLQATVNLQFNTATIETAGSWWGAPGYAGVPSFWGFPSAGYFAPWSYSTVAYKAGTLVIEMVDLRDGVVSGALDASVVAPAGIDASVSGGLEVIWAAYAHGVTTTLLSSFGPEALSAVDQAFAQSPYLQRAPETNTP